MAYIFPAPGVSGVQLTLGISVASNEAATVELTLPGIQDVTINAANDVFTWTQLNTASKLQIPTTATNSVSMNIVLDQTAWFGNSGATAGEADFIGVWDLSSDKTLLDFEIYLGDTDSGTTGKTISGQGYITGLAPTVSADAPVWVSPITITVTGDYTVA
jgi:hypothetical protein